VGILGLDDPIGSGYAPRGRRARGADTNLMVFIRYLGKQTLADSTAAGETARRLEAEPGRRGTPGDGEPLIAEFYDVTEIALHHPDFGGGLAHPGGGESAPADPARLPAAEPDSTRLLADLIRTCVSPSFWTSSPAGSVEAVAHGGISVRAPAPVQATIAAFLLDLRALESMLLTTRVHVVTGSLEPGTPRAAHLLPALARNPGLVPSDMTAVLEQAFRKDAAFRVISAPVLSTFQGQKASVVVANQVAYLQDHALEEDATGVILDPIVGTLQEGMLLELRAYGIPGGDWIRIAGSLEVAKLEGAMHKHPFGVPSDAGRGESLVTLEMPTCRRVLHAFTEVVPRDRGVLVGVPGAVRDLFGSGGDDGRRAELYLLIRASIGDPRQPAATRENRDSEPK
jgi:hypothetical protein